MRSEKGGEGEGRVGEGREGKGGIARDSKGGEEKECMETGN